MGASAGLWLGNRRMEGGPAGRLKSEALGMQLASGGQCAGPETLQSGGGAGPCGSKPHPSDTHQQSLWFGD